MKGPRESIVGKKILTLEFDEGHNLSYERG